MTEPAPVSATAAASAAAVAAVAVLDGDDTAATKRAGRIGKPPRKSTKRKGVKSVEESAVVVASGDEGSVKRARVATNGPTASKRSDKGTTAIPDSGDEGTADVTGVEVGVSADADADAEPAVPSVLARGPSRRRPVTREKDVPNGSASAAAAAAAAADVVPPVTTHAVVNTPMRELTASALDELIPMIITSTRTDDDDAGVEEGRNILYLSSMTIQPMLTAYCKRETSRFTHANVCKRLGTTQREVADADLIVMMIHGPMTEYDAAARRKWGGDPPNNYHWSVVVYSPGQKQAYHYDSKFPLNADRASEVLGVLKHHNVFATDAHVVSAPSFFPQQEGLWECGFYALIAIFIIAQKARAEPITQADVEAYSSYFNTIASNTNNSAIKTMLNGLLAAKAYSGLGSA